MNCDVTAEISTKDRYFTTLALAVVSVIQQSVSPARLIIYDDGEHKDLRGCDPYPHLLRMLDIKNIAWEVVYGDRKGQVQNHQKAILMSKTKYIWRLDDDNFAQHDVLEKLFGYLEQNNDVGAVGGLVIDPNQYSKYTEGASNKITDVFSRPNRQWCAFKDQSPTTTDVEHLYSTFLFRKDAASHGYCVELSEVGHREETLFTYEMFNKGWKLAIHPGALTWHYRSQSGGIRSFKDSKFWEHDEEIFRKKLNLFTSGEEWVVLDNGLGDHFVFKSILDEVVEKKKNKVVHLACCYPKVFEKEQGEGKVILRSIADAKNIIGNLDRYNVYLLGIHLNLSLTELYRKIYL